eukprot:gene18641-26349_t
MLYDLIPAPPLPRDPQGPGRRPGTRRLARHPQARRQGHAVPVSWLRAEPRRNRQRRAVRLRQSRDGDPQGHRVVLAVRTPPAAVYRQGSRRLHPERQGAGPVQGRADRRHVCAPPADPGKPYAADRRRHPGSDPGRRRGRGDRSQAHVHDDARRGETEFNHEHLGDARRLSRVEHHAHGVPATDWTEQVAMPQLQPGMARIRVKDLCLRTFIGINEDEILNKQDVLINLTILYAAQEAVRDNDIDHALNYRTITKAGGIETATSMHLWFDMGLTAFRAIFRVAGQPLLTKPITPNNGTGTLSPFVVLASSDAHGHMDASPRGGEPGFVKVLDAQTLLVPD